jgi:hypothetical protein
MDIVIKYAGGLLIIIFVLFVSIAAYHAFVEKAYRESLTSTYSYTYTISTDSVLSNVTLFIPVPSRSTGNSLIIEQFSVRGIEGIPVEWETTLIGSNKGTYVEIKTPVIVPVQTGTIKNGSIIELSLHMTSPRLVDTQNPQDNDAVFHPMKDMRIVDCPARVNDTTGKGACYSYVSTVYADYSASPNARVTISSDIIGKNTWKIFEPAENEYHAAISVLMFGDNHGWITAKGFLETGIGSYNAPFLLT